MLSPSPQETRACGSPKRVNGRHHSSMRNHDTQHLGDSSESLLEEARMPQEQIVSTTIAATRQSPPLSDNWNERKNASSPRRAVSPAPPQQRSRHLAPTGLPAIPTSPSRNANALIRSPPRSTQQQGDNVIPLFCARPVPRSTYRYKPPPKPITSRNNKPKSSHQTRDEQQPPLFVAPPVPRTTYQYRAPKKAAPRLESTTVSSTAAAARSATPTTFQARPLPSSTYRTPRTLQQAKTRRRRKRDMRVPPEPQDPLERGVTTMSIDQPGNENDGDISSSSSCWTTNPSEASSRSSQYTSSNSSMGDYKEEEAIETALHNDELDQFLESTLGGGDERPDDSLGIEIIFSSSSENNELVVDHHDPSTTDSHQSGETDLLRIVSRDTTTTTMTLPRASLMQEMRESKRDAPVLETQQYYDDGESVASDSSWITTSSSYDTNSLVSSVSCTQSAVTQNSEETPKVQRELGGSFSIRETDEKHQGGEIKSQSAASTQDTTTKSAADVALDTVEIVLATNDSDSLDLENVEVVVDFALNKNDVDQNMHTTLPTASMLHSKIDILDQVEEFELCLEETEQELNTCLQEIQELDGTNGDNNERVMRDIALANEAAEESGYDTQENSRSLGSSSASSWESSSSTSSTTYTSSTPKSSTSSSKESCLSFQHENDEPSVPISLRNGTDDATTVHQIKFFEDDHTDPGAMDPSDTNEPLSVRIMQQGTETQHEVREAGPVDVSIQSDANAVELEACIDAADQELKDLLNEIDECVESNPAKAASSPERPQSPLSLCSLSSHSLHEVPSNECLLYRQLSKLTLQDPVQTPVIQDGEEKSNVATQEGPKRSSTAEIPTSALPSPLAPVRWSSFISPTTSSGSDSSCSNASRKVLKPDFPEQGLPAKGKSSGIDSDVSNPTELVETGSSQSEVLLRTNYICTDASHPLDSPECRTLGSCSKSDDPDLTMDETVSDIDSESNNEIIRAQSGNPGPQGDSDTPLLYTVADLVAALSFSFEAAEQKLDACLEDIQSTKDLESQTPQSPLSHRSISSSASCGEELLREQLASLEPPPLLSTERNGDSDEGLLPRARTVDNEETIASCLNGADHQSNPRSEQIEQIEIESRASDDPPACSMELDVDEMEQKSAVPFLDQEKNEHKSHDLFGGEFTCDEENIALYDDEFLLGERSYSRYDESIFKAHIVDESICSGEIKLCTTAVTQSSSIASSLSSVTKAQFELRQGGSDEGDIDVATDRIECSLNQTEVENRILSVSSQEIKFCAAVPTQSQPVTSHPSSIRSSEIKSEALQGPTLSADSCRTEEEVISVCSFGDQGHDSELPILMQGIASWEILDDDDHDTHHEEFLKMQVTGRVIIEVDCENDSLSNCSSSEYEEITVSDDGQNESCKSSFFEYEEEEISNEGPLKRLKLFTEENHLQSSLERRKIWLTQALNMAAVPCLDHGEHCDNPSLQKEKLVLDSIEDPMVRALTEAKQKIAIGALSKTRAVTLHSNLETYKGHTERIGSVCSETMSITHGSLTSWSETDAAHKMAEILPLPSLTRAQRVLDKVMKKKPFLRHFMTSVARNNLPTMTASLIEENASEVLPPRPKMHPTVSLTFMANPLTPTTVNRVLSQAWNILQPGGNLYITHVVGHAEETNATAASSTKIQKNSVSCLEPYVPVSMKDWFFCVDDNVKDGSCKDVQQRVHELETVRILEASSRRTFDIQRDKIHRWRAIKPIDDDDLS